jgi:catechol 2,3-dioxygenase-like lactoylglutathione lyase family enzyme
MRRRASEWHGRDPAVLEKPSGARASSVPGMLNHINISGVFVLDQDEALDFYVNKLGLEVSNDVDLGFMRWLTVRVPGDPNREILLEKPGPPSMDEAAGNQIRELISKGASGFTVGFTTDDCRQTYATLVERGVDITQEPTTRDYGTDIGVRDPFGNHIRIVQPAQSPA